MLQPENRQASLALVARITLFSGLVLLVSGVVVWFFGLNADPGNATMMIAGLLIAGFGLLEALTSLLLRVALRSAQQRR